MMILEHMKTWSVSVVAAAIMIGLAWGAGVGAAAAGDPSLRLQGVIMERDGQTLVINERPLLLTTATKVLSMNKRPVSAEQLVRGQMVAVVAEPETTSGQKIKVVYVLPHQLDGADLTLLFADQSD